VRVAADLEVRRLSGCFGRVFVAQGEGKSGCYGTCEGDDEEQKEEAGRPGQHDRGRLMGAFHTTEDQRELGWGGGGGLEGECHLSAIGLGVGGDLLAALGG